MFLVKLFLFASYFFQSVNAKNYIPVVSVKTPALTHFCLVPFLKLYDPVKRENSFQASYFLSPEVAPSVDSIYFSSIEERFLQVIIGVINRRYCNCKNMRSVIFGAQDETVAIDLVFALMPVADFFQVIPGHLPVKNPVKFSEASLCLLSDVVAWNSLFAIGIKPTVENPVQSCFRFLQDKSFISEAPFAHCFGVELSNFISPCTIQNFMPHSPSLFSLCKGAKLQPMDFKPLFQTAQSAPIAKKRCTEALLQADFFDEVPSCLACCERLDSLRKETKIFKCASSPQVCTGFYCVSSGVPPENLKCKCGENKFELSVVPSSSMGRSFGCKPVVEDFLARDKEDASHVLNYLCSNLSEQIEKYLCGAGQHIDPELECSRANLNDFLIANRALLEPVDIKRIENLFEEHLRAVRPGFRAQAPCGPGQLAFFVDFTSASEFGWQESPSRRRARARAGR